MTTEQAQRELVKVAIGFGLLQNGAISTMSQKDYEKVMEWLK
jgi:hypothetical protein